MTWGFCRVENGIFVVFKVFKVFVDEV